MLFALFVANVRSFCRRCSELLPSVFGNGGGRCSETLVVDVRKWWWTMFGVGGLLMPWASLPHAMSKYSSWHEQYLLMPWGDHLFRTTATTLSEQRQPPFPNNGNHPFRTTATPFPNEDQKGLKTRMLIRKGRSMECGKIQNNGGNAIFFWKRGYMWYLTK